MCSLCFSDENDEIELLDSFPKTTEIDSPRDSVTSVDVERLLSTYKIKKHFNGPSYQKDTPNKLTTFKTGKFN